MFFPIGKASYIEENNGLWLSTLHSLWFLPLCYIVLYVDYKPRGIELSSFKSAIFINCLMASIAYYLSQDSTKIKYNFNTGHEFWTISESFQFNQLIKNENESYLRFIMWSLLIESFLFNGICFIFLKIISYLLIELTQIKSEKFKNKKQD